MNRVISNFEYFLNQLHKYKPEAHAKWSAVTVADYAGGRLVLEANTPEIAAYVEPKIDVKLRADLGLGTAYGVQTVEVRVKHQGAKDTSKIEAIAPTESPQFATMKEGVDWEAEYKRLAAETRAIERRNAELEAQVAELERQLAFERDWKQINGGSSNEKPSVDGQTIWINRDDLVELLPNLTPRSAKTTLILLSLIGQKEVDAALISALSGYKSQKAWAFLTDGNPKIAEIGQGFLTFCPVGAEKTTILPAGGKNSTPYNNYNNNQNTLSPDGELLLYGQPPADNDPETDFKNWCRELHTIGYDYRLNLNWLKELFPAIPKETRQKYIQMARAKQPNPGGYMQHLLKKWQTQMATAS